MGVDQQDGGIERIADDLDRQGLPALLDAAQQHAGRRRLARDVQFAAIGSRKQDAAVPMVSPLMELESKTLRGKPLGLVSFARIWIVGLVIALVSQWKFAGSG